MADKKGKIGKPAGRKKRPARNGRDTIAAIATPEGVGGIGIVRLSGPRAISIAAGIFRLNPKRNITKLPSHTLHYGLAVSGKKTVDEGLLAVMRAPHSYTRENVVEIQAHGGMFPLQKILGAAVKKGARLAEPGEFTRRAFINGRLDLAQAEAVVDLIRARTETAYETALGQLSGGLSERVKDLRRRLRKSLTGLEAQIDFPGESGVVPGKSFSRSLKAILEEIRELEGSADKGRIIREGIKAVIIGRPNVGKSSLMNALLQEKRVIVTHLPGTTRDVIEEMVNIRGIPVRIADTAGFGRSRNLIEIQGAARARVYLEMADLVILVIDGSQGIKKEDREIIKLAGESQKKVLVAINKSDLPARWKPEAVKRLFPVRQIVQISAKTLSGFPALQRKLATLLGIKQAETKEGVLVSRLRHRLALQRAAENLNNALAARQKGFSGELVAFDLWQALESLGTILGLNYKEDVLEEIFSEFCIGK